MKQLMLLTSLLMFNGSLWASSFSLNLNGKHFTCIEGNREAQKTCRILKHRETAGGNNYQCSAWYHANGYCAVVIQYGLVIRNENMFSNAEEAAFWCDEQTQN